MYSVGTDKGIGCDALSVLKFDVDAITAICEGDQTVADMQSLDRKSGNQHRQHVGAMGLIVRKPKRLYDCIAERRL